MIRVLASALCCIGLWVPTSTAWAGIACVDACSSLGSSRPCAETGLGCDPVTGQCAICQDASYCQPGGRCEQGVCVGLPCQGGGSSDMGPTDMAQPDSGSGTDGGSADGGPVRDGGASDGGSDPDAGATDGGSDPDGGADPDAGSMADAGSMVDGGSMSDAGSGSTDGGGTGVPPMLGGSPRDDIDPNRERDDGCGCIHTEPGGRAALLVVLIGLLAVGWLRRIGVEPGC